MSVTSFVGGSVEINAALDSDSGVLYQSGSVTFDGEEQSYNPGDEFRESGGGMGGFGGGSLPAQP